MSVSNNNLTRDEIAVLYRDKMSALYNQVELKVNDHHLNFADNVLSKNAPALHWVVNGLNNAAKQAFQAVTGIKLHKTQKKAWEQLCVWGGYSNEQQQIDDLLRQLAERQKAFTSQYSVEAVNAFIENAVRTVKDGFNKLELIDNRWWLLNPQKSRGINLSARGVAEQQSTYKILVSLRDISDSALNRALTICK